MSRSHRKTAPDSKPAPAKRKFNLETAETADGALPSLRSAYELVGIKDFQYKAKTFSEYQGQLRAMDLIELQDHAYDYAVVPSQSAEVMIARLEEKYLRENPEQRLKVAAERQAQMESESEKEQVDRILSRGR